MRSHQRFEDFQWELELKRIKFLCAQVKIVSTQCESEIGVLLGVMGNN